jgi:hypothetical protein
MGFGKFEGEGGIPREDGVIEGQQGQGNSTPSPMDRVFAGERGGERWRGVRGQGWGRMPSLFQSRIFDYSGLKVCLSTFCCCELSWIVKSYMCGMNKGDVWPL